MVFDEIDAGIGGTTAHAVAETLRRLAGRAQVLTITHLPQIATVADRHFSVEKIPGDPTHTRIEPLDDAQRRDELERMLGGADFLATIDRVREAGEHGEPGAARPARGRLEVPRRAVPPLRLVARDHGRRAGPARVRARRPLAGAGRRSGTSSSGAGGSRRCCSCARSTSTSAGRWHLLEPETDTEIRLRATAARPDARHRHHLGPAWPTRGRSAAASYDLVQTAARCPAARSSRPRRPPA